MSIAKAVTYWQRMQNMFKQSQKMTVVDVGGMDSMPGST
jgi:hypothetical protein